MIQNKSVCLPRPTKFVSSAERWWFVNDLFASKLAALGMERPKWCIAPSEKLVRNFKKRFSVVLPADYRQFLVHHGGVFGSATCSFQEPTPCGTKTCINCFYGFTSKDRTENVVDATELIEGAPDVVAIGDNQMGAMFWLMCTGQNAGCVYMHDQEQRSEWPDEQFAEWFPSLSSDIKEYLELRKQGKLPKKPTGFEHVYLLSKTFTEFIDSLESEEGY